ncbi:hypothetical protein ACF09K_25820 [Streptomyces sp. NPDC014882]|uniref:hypothetical protein n=1 Tax=Streptomyces sp. NPDC014882 TaxID=3364927 RepID=UPI0036FAA17F
MSGPAPRLAVGMDDDGARPAGWRRAAHSPDQPLTPRRVAQVSAVAENAGFTLITSDDGALPPGAAPLGTGPRHMVDKKLSHTDRNAAASGTRSGLT